MHVVASLLLAIGAVTAAPEIADASVPAPDTVVVCPLEFREALAPWLEFRRSQGHTIQVASNDGTPEQIRERIRSAAPASKLRFVVLVGGVNSRMSTDPGVVRRSIPPHLEPAKVVVHWGSGPNIATDNWYADLDGDGVPDVAIGRLTVESADELAKVVKKILAYEKEPDFHRWRSRINFVAGASGFNPVVDALLETTSRRLISGGVPAAYETTLTYANWHSAYCPDPRLFHATMTERLNEGCLFWVYMGHGQPTGLAPLQLPGGNVPCLNCRDMTGLHCACGSPIAIFLACYTAAFDSRERCLADEMLRAEGAPVAVIGASRVTMPYAMTVFGSELLDQCFQTHCATLGEAMLGAKRRSVGVGVAAWDSRRLIIDALAQAVSPPGSDLAAERMEHLHLFNLIGDPLLQLHYPRELDVAAVPSAAVGSHVSVSGHSPCDGPCTIELVADHDDTGTTQQRQQFDLSSDALRDYQRVYRQANRPALSAIETTAQAGHFTASLEIPPAAAGRCRIRTFVAGKTDCALGSAAIDVQPLVTAAK